MEQRSRDSLVGSEAPVNTPLDLPLPPTPPPQPLWDRQSRHDTWSQSDMNSQRLGIEWDTINDLRIDMVRLHQRMNNMQRMMETCMDMQIELQRSIRQEVSAALNRSTGSSGSPHDSSSEDKSKWECVRKGLCCICCESNIDSLLYRCGHMCTCSKCASDLLQSKRKCPMCQAPVVEVIRAYSIQ
uniref:RING-type domain-containing protein n=1 Tax=Lotus japonicus TaxID=34305 RepID=I3SAF5_LOTJA|nr:unknown [Lotus japonicus]